MLARHLDGNAVSIWVQKERAARIARARVYARLRGAEHATVIDAAAAVSVPLFTRGLRVNRDLCYLKNIRERITGRAASAGTKRPLFVVGVGSTVREGRTDDSKKQGRFEGQRRPARQKNESRRRCQAPRVEAIVASLSGRPALRPYSFFTSC
eukprot:6188346-Pleurochrysis_carterae.AAC.2